MSSLIPLDDLAADASITFRAAVLAMAKRLLSRALRAAANAIALLADFLDPPKKEKGLNVVRC